VSHRIATERWQELAPTVICTTTGPLSVEQRQWLGVLHAGEGALVAGLTAAESAGLHNWSREEISILVPYTNEVPNPVPGIAFIRSRRKLSSLKAPNSAPPRCRIEPAVLLFASAQRSSRSAQGVLAAAVQQQLTSPDALTDWVRKLRPLRRAALFRATLEEIAGGAQSVSELDVSRMCRAHGLRRPDRQVKRRDADGRMRFTDCEWRLPNGKVLILEVDGSFHMEVEHWEDDLARQRALSGEGRIIIRCTSRELREHADRLAADLIRLGVPRVVSGSVAQSPR
jgi:hypothetical protein